MRRATEDEQPVHFLQASQLGLAQRAGLLQPSESLFDQPSAAQADGIAGLARGSAVQVAGAAFVVNRYREPGSQWSRMRVRASVPIRRNQSMFSPEGRISIGKRNSGGDRLPRPKYGIPVAMPTSHYRSIG